ncbi:MAG: DedA family protein [Chloroflexota bacterium]|nr:DedA family protein [Chloroflexota bacterium]
MEWWDAVRAGLNGLLDQHGVLAGFVLILIEEAGVPVPIPGDFLMLLLGVHARQGRVPLWQALLVMELATLVGATGLYLAASHGGRSLVYRYGRYMHLTPERLARAERWLVRHGALAIVAGRLTPGLRMATVITCGVLGVPLHKFLPGLAVGSFLYILLYTLLGFFLGPPILLAVEGIHLPLGLLGSLVPLVVLLVWIVRARRGLHLRLANDASTVDSRHRIRDGAVAGLLATVVSTLAMNVLVHVIGDATVLPPSRIVEHTQARLAAFAIGRALGPLLLVVLPVFAAVGMVWGGVYAAWVEPRLARLPDWFSGLVFTLLPLAFALVVVPPLVGAALPWQGSIGLLVIASEIMRHVVYGVVLGLTYPLRLARRASRDRTAPSPSLESTPGLVAIEP